MATLFEFIPDGTWSCTRQYDYHLSRDRNTSANMSKYYEFCIPQSAVTSRDMTTVNLASVHRVMCAAGALEQK